MTNTDPLKSAQCILERGDHACGSLASRGATRAFTLIEMMVVIVIVAILAIISIEAYRLIMSSSHMTEATNMVQAIRVAEEAYHAEAQSYYQTTGGTASLSLSTGCPSQNPQNFVTQPWGTAGSSCATNWAPLPVHTDGPLMFAYAVTAGKAGSTVAPSSVPVAIGSGGPVGLNTISSIGTSADWYVIGAWDDYNADGILYAQVYGVSSSNDLMIFNEGQ